MAGVSLQDRGWFLSEEGLTQCTQNGRKDPESVIKLALDIDLREIGKGWLPEDVNRGKADYVQGPGVLQLQKIRNVSAPKDNEESQFAPRLMKLVLTDGHTTCSAVETELLKDIGSNTPPGSKLLLMKTVDVEHGFLLLNNKNTRCLGGRVDKLAEGWELKKKLAKQHRSKYGNEGGPPPFVPFGQRIGTDAYKPTTRRDNFKSLDTNKAEKKSEDGEFEQQRKATIAEAMQAKEDGQSKKFGGSKQVTNDHDVARITEMGFRTEEAVSALKITNNDVSQAIEHLLKNKGSGVGDRRSGPGGVFNKQSNFDSDRGDRGRGRRDRRDDDTGGGGRGKRGRDTDEGGELSSKPSAPATLFDFLSLSNKIPESKGTQPEKKSTGKETSTRNNDYNERNRTTSGGSDHSGRPKQQTVPPRFVNKSKQEYQGQQNRGRYQDDRSDRSQRGRDDRPNTAPAENRRYDNRGGSDKGRNYEDRNRNSDNRYQNYNDRNKNYNDRDNDRNDRNQRDSEFKGRGGRNEDKNFRQDGNRTSGYDSKSGGTNTRQSDNSGYSRENQRQSDNSGNSRGYQKQTDNIGYNRGNQRQNDDSGYNRGNQKTDKSSAKYNQSSSDSQQKQTDSNVNKSQTSQYDRNDQGQGRNYQGQGQRNNDTRQNQSSASNYKQDSYSRGDNSNRSQSNSASNNRNGNAQPYAGNNSYIPQNPGGNYRNVNNYPVMSTSSGQYQQPPSEYIYSEAQPMQININIGDTVMAKYWEDGLFYEAVIETTTPGLPTVVVTFLEYGNTEEVLLSDVRPFVQQMIPQQGAMIPTDMSVPPPQVFYSNQPPVTAAAMEEVIQGINTMEFRRGGGGATYTRKDNRGQQQYYQPPAQRR